MLTFNHRVAYRGRDSAQGVIDRLRITWAFPHAAAALGLEQFLAQYTRKAACDTAEISREIVSDRVREIPLFGVAAEIVERQHDDREWRPTRGQRRLIVRLHQAAVAEDVGGQYGDKLARRHAFRHGQENSRNRGSGLRIC